ncbi:hypothetical protein VCRA2113O415_350060 [Vibrio crassostreae]|nr:hypothetical protein VCRA2113O415_350060 [Vibrio crassostreae]CAK2806958.1 hypothetical protein VCRA2113O420_340061 [Vibrio crassostreae]CAK3423295.1 hypothetical protein VCRA2121O436_350061 [Vibrio crassostreae]
MRIEKTLPRYDLLGQTSFGVRCPMGKLSFKVEVGHLVGHQSTQGKTEK